MLKVTVYGRGDIVILRCRGQLVAGVDPARLSSAVRSRGEVRTMFLDLADVNRIDAAGLGVLLTLRAWSNSTGIKVHLMNVRGSVLKVLKLTRLDRVFEVFFVERLLPQLLRLSQPVCAEGFAC